MYFAFLAAVVIVVAVTATLNTFFALSLLYLSHVISYERAAARLGKFKKTICKCKCMQFIKIKFENLFIMFHILICAG